MDRVLTVNSDLYPRRLRGLRSAPDRLHVRGTWREHELAVTIVGARAASGRARAVAADLAERVVAAGGAVLSGGAIGVDGAAHRATLDAGGFTGCALASGFDQLYPPRHRPLLDEIGERGALLSSYAPSVPPRRYHFVRRNWLLAALADLVVVVESERASGCHYTARAALELGRRLAAVPGSPGCEGLIAQGAFPLESGADVALVARGGIAPPRPRFPRPDSEEGRALAALGDRPLGPREVASKAGLDELAASRALAGLELARLAIAVPGAAYVRSALGQVEGN
jgi:DNA processing protein